MVSVGCSLTSYWLKTETNWEQHTTTPPLCIRDGRQLPFAKPILKHLSTQQESYRTDTESL